MEVDENDGTVTLRLSKPEALVLFEWLHRHEDQDEQFGKLGLADPAEQRVLWDMSAELESTLVEPFRADWSTVVDDARRLIRERSN